MKTRYTLVGHEIEGEWNVPLLANAAAMCGASLLFVDSQVSANAPGIGSDSHSVRGGEELLHSFDHVLACETGANSRPIYDFAMPRGNIAFIVGNERRGIPGKLLSKVDQVVSIPMLGKGLTSVNVAVAAAIILYAAERDLGRKRWRPDALSHRDVDVLVFAPSDPSEIGSLLRSAWAFGWRRIFVVDQDGAWFTSDRSTILAGRAAARCEANRIAVCPMEQLNLGDYGHVILCDGARDGDPLSTCTLPQRGRLLLVYGKVDESLFLQDRVEHIYVDHACSSVDPCFRHAGSILLSVVSQRITRRRHG